jgi:hypothetical protein
MGSDMYRIWGERSTDETAVAGFSDQSMPEVKPLNLLFIDESMG